MTMPGESCMLTLPISPSIIVLVQTGLQQQRPQAMHAHQLQPHLHSVTTNCWVFQQ